MLTSIIIIFILFFVLFIMTVKSRYPEIAEISLLDPKGFYKVMMTLRPLEVAKAND